MVATSFAKTLPWQVGFGPAMVRPSDTSSDWAVTIDGLGFALAASPDQPLIRRGAEYRNDSVNFSSEPGEVGLGFWWQRSQSSWHNGGGNPSFDGPGSAEPAIAISRFNTSFGVNPWTPGRLELLPDTSRLATATAGVGLLPIVDPAGVPRAVWADGTALKYWNGSSAVAIVWGGAGSIKSFTTDGTKYYVVDGVGIYSGTVGGAAGTLQYNVTGTRFRLRWVKQRLVLTADNAVYELDGTGAPALPVAKFSHPNAAWIWTDLCEGPGAIYASGYSGTTSAVYKFVLDNTGLVPTLSTGITACELPQGEQVHTLCSYIGAFVALGTSQGIRVCSFNGADIGLAPLTFDTLGPVKGITGWSRYLYATVNDAGGGSCGLARIDLGRMVGPDQYAFACDLRANTSAVAQTVEVGAPGAVAMVDGKVTFLVPTNGIFQEHPTRLCFTGRLTTGQINFGTADEKIFQRVLVRSLGEGRVVMATALDGQASGTSLGFTLNLDTKNILDVGVGPLRGGTFTLEMTLERKDDTSGPSLRSWQIKALPGQAREESLIIPLQCYDRTELPNGTTAFRPAGDAIESIRALVRSQQPVYVRTFFGDPSYDWRTWLAQVENYEFRQVTSEPDQGWGGTLTVSLRTVSGE